jgi:uncharacterized protein YndB with AHSA1/START domain
MSTTPDLLTVQVRLSCSPAHAWAAYTDPKAITQWNFAAPEWHCPRAENDLRVGGSLRTRMEARDGSMGFDFEGIYTAVDSEKHLAYALGPDRQVIASFVDTGDGHTELTVNFTPDSAYPAEYQVGGWQAILNNYKAYAERPA